MLDGVKFESYIAYVEPTMWFLWKTLRVQGLNNRVSGPKYCYRNGIWALKPWYLGPWTLRERYPTSLFFDARSYIVGCR